MAEPWHLKLARLQEARGWTLRDLTTAYIAASPHHAESQFESVERQLKRYRRGEVANPTAETQAVIARVFDLPVADFFPAPETTRDVAPARLGHDEFAELISGLRTSRVGSGQLEQASAEVERLCTAYASQEADSLTIEVDQWTHELAALVRDGRVSLDGHREVLRLTGWLALLRSCLSWDQGDERGTLRSRVAAQGLAADLHDGVQEAWAWEVRAWMALTQGDMAQVIASANAGIRCAPNSSVAAQLHAQKAKAYARMNDQHKTEVALDQVRQVLDRCEHPDNVRNHFVVDPTKASFYAMDAYRILRGSEALAEAMADTVITTSTRPDSTVLSPMRLAEAQLTKAVLVARNGSPEKAVQLADEALTHNRRSTPSLALVAGEVATEVSQYAPSQGAEFRNHLRDLTKSSD